jgi:hypothetical protein
MPRLLGGVFLLAYHNNVKTQLNYETRWSFKKLMAGRDRALPS